MWLSSRYKEKIIEDVIRVVKDNVHILIKKKITCIKNEWKNVSKENKSYKGIIILNKQHSTINNLQHIFLYFIKF